MVAVAAAMKQVSNLRPSPRYDKTRIAHHPLSKHEPSTDVFQGFEFGGYRPGEHTGVSAS